MKPTKIAIISFALLITGGILITTFLQYEYRKKTAVLQEMTGTESSEKKTDTSENIIQENEIPKNLKPPEGWKKAHMGTSDISFFYPENWNYRQIEDEYGRSGKIEIVQIFSRKEREEGYFCIEFRGYEKSKTPIWNCDPKKQLKNTEIIKTASKSIKVGYSEIDSKEKSHLSSCIEKNNREIGIAAGFNCGQSDDKYLRDKNASFRNSPEVDIARKVLETLEF
ncbi:MAG: hypothetical protein IPL87_00010 [Candidatus Moraniibacteriota bacterium]|nr:MAG: hypothetical protein IPL87_00010 [Candidatus Moranbacteria bacterium]